MEVKIIMGSISDKEVGQEVVDMLTKFKIDYSWHVLSAHRSPDKVRNLVLNEDNDTGVYIAIAGKAAHLGGVIASHTAKPVIGVPVKSSMMGGLDALLSTVQMPSGVPVATVAVNGGKNAAILAIQILSIADPKLQKALKDYKHSLDLEVDEMNKELNS